jgi:glycogen(starch) synthase
MNIAIFASAFYPHVGGVEELCRQLSHTYRQRGHSVCILTNRWPRQLAAREEVEGVPVFRLAMRTPDAGFKSKITYRLTSALIEREIAQILREQRVDLVQVQCVGNNAHYAACAARRLDLPLVVSLQGELKMDATQLFLRSAFARETLHTVLRQASYVTACSQQTLAEAEEFFGKSLAGKASVIRNGVRCSDFAGVQPWPHPRPYILGIGRQVAQKGFDVLIRALAQLPDGGDLVLAGDGPEQPALRRLAEELGIAARVIFTGRVNRARTAALFAGCALFVLPSRYEPFGIVNLEAMASGKAVIATRVGGVPEIVRHGETGWLVPREDPAELGAAIAQLLADAPLRQRLERAGREVAAQHDWAHLAGEYEAIYRRVLYGNEAAA